MENESEVIVELLRDILGKKDITTPIKGRYRLIVHTVMKDRIKVTLKLIIINLFINVGVVLKPTILKDH